MKMKTMRGGEKRFADHLALWLLGGLLIFLGLGCASTNNRSDEPWDSQLEFDDPTEDRLIK